jgi:hypothetical protein
MAAYNADPAYWQRLNGEDPQFSNNHNPDAAHGGAIPPSGWWPRPGVTANPVDLNATLRPQAPATDVRPQRSLGRFTSDPSEDSRFVAPLALRQVPCDGSLSLNDAYLEYLRRLNASPSPVAADQFDAALAVNIRTISRQHHLSTRKHDR